MPGHDGGGARAGVVEGDRGVLDEHLAARLGCRASAPMA
jgi:hypothetical protein